MEANTILISALVNILVGVIKNIPKVPSWSLPLIAIALGGFIWPLYVGSWAGATIIMGFVVGAGAVGLYEVANKIGKDKATLGS